MNRGKGRGKKGGSVLRTPEQEENYRCFRAQGRQRGLDERVSRAMPGTEQGLIGPNVPPNSEP